MMLISRRNQEIAVYEMNATENNMESVTISIE